MLAWGWAGLAGLNSLKPFNELGISREGVRDNVQPRALPTTLISAHFSASYLLLPYEVWAPPHKQF